MGFHWLLFFLSLLVRVYMLGWGARTSALELMQGGEMPIICIHISVQSRVLNRSSDDVKNKKVQGLCEHTNII